METPELKIVALAACAPRGGGRTAIALAACLLALAGLATLLGADRARRPADAREIAEETMRRALLAGTEDPDVRARLLDLRSTLGRRPLDSMTRAAYASLLLSLSRGADDVPAAVFHVRRAVELAPVTLPVVRSAVLVLAYTREVNSAASLVRGVFAYAPESAASWLARIEPLLGDVPLERAIPEDPAAWTAWSLRLDLDGRHAEALEWLERGVERWPEDLPLLERATFHALREENWARLAELLPPERELPLVRAAAAIFVHRARLRIAAGDLDSARADLARALALEEESPNVRIAAGQAYVEAGDAPAARRTFTMLLYDLEPGQEELRRSLLENLARLEDEYGTPAAALRAWRALAALDPEHQDAVRRIDDLTGFNRAP